MANAKSPNPPFGKPLGINDVNSYVNLESIGDHSASRGAKVRVQYGNSGTEQGTGPLPVIDTQRSLRNFEGYEKNVWYSLGELQDGAYAGVTETDSKTETAADHAGKRGTGGYAGQQKSGSGGRGWKSSSKKGWY